MFELVSLAVMVIVTLVTSAVGAICVMRGLKIFDLSIGARNLMYLGACCAMVLGFLGATVCAETIMMTKWHVLAIPALIVAAVCATAHIAVDCSDRLRIVKSAVNG